jgi:hypothetical protein
MHQGISCKILVRKHEELEGKDVDGRIEYKFNFKKYVVRCGMA